MTDVPQPLLPDAMATGIDPGPGWQWRYFAIFGGQAVSLIGSALTQFVLIWWITDTTGSISALAIAGMVALLPHALLGPIGGTLADRYSRRFIMIAADLTSAICMSVLIALFLTDTVQLWHIYVMMFIRSAMQAFQQPAAMASTAMLVPASFLTRAAGLNQSLMGIMTIAAAPLGAIAISVMPIGLALGIDVFTAILGIGPLLYYAIPQIRNLGPATTSLWREFRDGVDLVWHNRGLRWLYLMMTGVVVMVMPSFTLMPLLVKEHFGGGAPQVALIESIGGLGMILGGMLVAVFPPRHRMLWVIWGFALSCIAMGLAALVPGHLFWLAIVWWFLSSVIFIAGNAPLTAIVQTTVPNQLQGRVLSLMGTLMGLAAPVGLVVAIPLGELIGVRWLFVAMGMAGGAVALLGLLSTAMRAMDRPPAA